MAGASDLLCAGLRVTRVSTGVSRLPDRGGTRGGPGERALGRVRLRAGRARPRGRFRGDCATLQRYDLLLVNPFGTAQPCCDGRAGGQPTRRRARALTRGGAYDELADVAIGLILRRDRDGGCDIQRPLHELGGAPGSGRGAAAPGALAHASALAGRGPPRSPGSRPAGPRAWARPATRTGAAVRPVRRETTAAPDRRGRGRPPQPSRGHLAPVTATFKVRRPDAVRNLSSASNARGRRHRRRGKQPFPAPRTTRSRPFPCRSRAECELHARFSQRGTRRARLRWFAPPLSSVPRPPRDRTRGAERAPVDRDPVALVVDPDTAGTAARS